MTEILKVRNLIKHYQHPPSMLGRIWKSRNSTRPVVAAVDDVSFSLRKGEIFAILGESGSGKTTLVRTILRLTEANNGEVIYRGENILEYSPLQVKKHVRPNMRMIFQHPDAVLNPSFTVNKVLKQALNLYAPGEAQHHREEMITRLKEVGLPESYLNKYPHELSGGEKRRIGICRALLTNPEIVFADELISGLDVFWQQQILSLFLTIKNNKNISTVYISHDVGLVHQVADDIAVMFKGKLVEVGRKALVSGSSYVPSWRPDASHPYTQELIGCHLTMNSAAKSTPYQLGGDGNGNLSTITNTGCVFRFRCPKCKDKPPTVCVEENPLLHEIEPDHFVACHFVEALR